MRVLVTVASVCSYLLIYFLITMLKPPTEDYLFKLQKESHSTLHSFISSEQFTGILPSVKSLQQGYQQGNSQHDLMSQINVEGSCLSSSGIAQMMNSSNCFPLGSPQCKQHKIISRIINGATTSFSLSHAGEENSKIQYRKDLFQNVSKVNDLLFLYQLTARALKELSPTLQTRLAITPEGSNYARVTQLLQKLLSQINNSSLGPIEKEVQRFMKDSSRAKQFAAYIDGNAKLLNLQCANSQQSLKSIPFQIEGLKTMINALLGQKQELQSSQLAALLNLFHKLSLSVGDFYSQRPTAESLEHMEGQFDTVQFYYFLGGAVLVMVLLFSQINIKGKVQKQFRHSFPNNRRFKIE